MAKFRQVHWVARELILHCFKIIIEFNFFAFKKKYWGLYRGEKHTTPLETCNQKNRNFALGFFGYMWTSHFGLILFISSILH